MIRRIRRKQDSSKTKNGHHHETSGDDNAGQSAEQQDAVKSSQRVREHALRVMRATREQLDDELLEQAQTAIIDNAMATFDARDSYAHGETTPIDKRKNLKTIKTLLEKHSTSQDMQRNIAAILQEMRKQ